MNIAAVRELRIRATIGQVAPANDSADVAETLETAMFVAEITDSDDLVGTIAELRKDLARVLDEAVKAGERADEADRRADELGCDLDQAKREIESLERQRDRAESVTAARDLDLEEARAVVPSPEQLARLAVLEVDIVEASKEIGRLLRQRDAAESLLASKDTGVNGASVIARRDGCIYIRLPRGAQRICGGRCTCEPCERLGTVAMWDTLVVSTRKPAKSKSDTVWTCHMPEPR